MPQTKHKNQFQMDDRPKMQKEKAIKLLEDSTRE